MLDQSKLHGSSNAQYINKLQVVQRGDKYSSKRVPAAVISTHHKSACASLCRAAAGVLDQSKLHGDKHSSTECRRQRQPRTLSPPLPRTVEQPQECSTSRSFMCVCNQMCINCRIVSQARPHKSVNTHLVPQAGRSSVNPDRMPTAGLSSHPDSSWSELHGGFRCEGQATCRCVVLAASTLHP